MINLGKLILPSVISVDDINDKISLRIPDAIKPEYINCVEMNLQLTFIGSCIEIDYYSDEDKLLRNIIRLELTEIAVGKLNRETFESIQEQALKVLCEFIDDSQQEMLEQIKRSGKQDWLLNNIHSII